MNTNNFEQDHISSKSIKMNIDHDGAGDVTIDIFCESMNDYLKKLNAALAGRYELDDYDMQVISVAMSQWPVKYI